MKRKIPRLRTDAAAEAFLRQDLSNLDFSRFHPTRFEFEQRTAQRNIRLPASLRDAVKQRTSAHGIPCTRFTREAVDHAPARPRKPR